MPFWEYQIALDEINEMIKQENEENERQSESYGNASKYDPKKMMSSYSNKIPNYGNFKMPKI